VSDFAFLALALAEVIAAGLALAAFISERF
jgi:hypothetical protein